jgi:hypothetical protein
MATRIRISVTEFSVGYYATTSVLWDESTTRQHRSVVFALASLIETLTPESEQWTLAVEFDESDLGATIVARGRSGSTIEADRAAAIMRRAGVSAGLA